MDVSTHPTIWAQRVLVVVLPLLGGDLVGSALSQRSGPVATALTSLAWIVWAITAIAVVIPHPFGLTALRITTPAIVIGLVWALTETGTAHLIDVLSMIVAAVIAVLAASSWVADSLIDGRSYGDERRFSLRIPVTLLLGPIPLAIVLPSATSAATVALMASRQFAFGAIIGLVGGVLSAFAIRSLHTLATRFVVFVPAGMTIVDPLILTDSILFPRARVIRIGPAPAATTGTDLSQNAPGLALQLDLDSPTSLTIIHGRASAEEVSTRQVIFTPGRPNAVLDEAERRLFKRG